MRRQVGIEADACRDALRRLRTDWPPGTELLVVEVHDQGDPGVRDLVAYPMNRSGDQVAGVHQVVAHDCPVEEPPPESDRRRRVTEFVASCWLAVGVGGQLPAYVAPHDYWESFDVRAQRWVPNAAVYSE